MAEVAAGATESDGTRASSTSIGRCVGEVGVEDSGEVGGVGLDARPESSNAGGDAVTAPERVGLLGGGSLGGG